MPAVVGIDSSTQSTKVVVCDLETGEERASARAAHPATVPPVSEQHPDAWWTALTDAFDRLAGHLDDVVALSVGGQQHGLVVLGDDDEPLRPAKLWNDTTSAAEADALVADLGAAHWAEACGSVPVPAFTVTKLAWLAAHEPATVERIRRIMLPHDYLTWRLTGAHVTDRGDASGTGWFDAASGQYRGDLLATAVAVAIDDAASFIDRLPTVLDPMATAGTVTGDVAAALGLPDDVIVAPGSGDNMAAALGLGLDPGDVAMSLGTSGTVYARSSVATADPSGLVAGFADAAGGFLPLVCTLNATQVTDTVAGWLGTDAAGLDAIAADAGPAADDVILVPYFVGERTPNLPDATGSFHGLRTTTSRESLARAAHDGVLCGLFAGLDALRDAGVRDEGRLLLIGGGARSGTYRQRCADLAGMAVDVPDDDEVVALGAAVQAAAVHSGTAPGEFREPWQLGTGTTVEPQAAADGGAVRARYREIAATIAR